MNGRSVSASNARLLELVTRLGAAFRARGMEEHARRLRLYWLAARHGLLKGRNELDVTWSEAHVVDWLKALGVPPFEGALPVRAPGSGCPACPVEPGVVPSARVDLVFPGGARLKCTTCGGQWVEGEGRGSGASR